MNSLLGYVVILRHWADCGLPELQNGESLASVFIAQHRSLFGGIQSDPDKRCGPYVSGDLFSHRLHRSLHGILSIIEIRQRNDMPFGSTRKKDAAEEYKWLTSSLQEVVHFAGPFSAQHLAMMLLGTRLYNKPSLLTQAIIAMSTSNVKSSSCTAGPKLKISKPQAANLLGAMSAYLEEPKSMCRTNAMHH
jgi:hypothetical protein